MEIQTIFSNDINIYLINIADATNLLQRDYVKSWFDSADLLKWDAITSEKRKREIAATRYLLFKLDLSKDFYYSEAAPMLSNKQFISISHSHDWVGLALSSKYPIGFDLELIQEKIARVYDKFTHQDERKFFTPESIEKLTVLWSIKESVYKLFRQKGLSFSEDICVYQEPSGQFKAVVSVKDGIFEVPLTHQVIDQYVLTFNSGDVQKQA